jgi:hypothetical protein
MSIGNSHLFELDIERKIKRLFILSFVGSISLGLGLFGLFGRDPASLHELFGQQEFVYALIAIGLSIEVIHYALLLPLLKQRSVIRQN